MKHILNNLSNEEKNSIREQHTGGMKVMTESFSRLLNAKLGDSKPLVNEQSTPQTTGTAQPVPPPVPTIDKSFNDKTVNLYFNSKNSNFFKTIKIKTVDNSSSGKVVFSTGDAQLTFSCLDKSLMYEIKAADRGYNKYGVYNTPFTTQLIKTFCTKSSGGVSVPKADFAANSSNTNANFT